MVNWQRYRARIFQYGNTQLLISRVSGYSVDIVDYVDSNMITLRSGQQMPTCQTIGVKTTALFALELPGLTLWTAIIGRFIPNILDQLMTVPGRHISPAQVDQLNAQLFRSVYAGGGVVAGIELSGKAGQPLSVFGSGDYLVWNFDWIADIAFFKAKPRYWAVRVFTAKEWSGVGATVKVPRTDKTFTAQSIEEQCLNWLKSQWPEDPGVKKPDWFKSAQRSFKGLSEAAFNREWAEAAKANPQMSARGAPQIPR